MAYATGDIVIIQDADLELDPSEYARILEPLVAGRADVVYGSRFMAKPSGIPLRTRLGNRFTTTLANLLFGARLTDMHTAYKAFRRDLLEGLHLRCVRFNFDPEITARFLLAGYQIHEVPISYAPRTQDEGKKVRWMDGVEAILTLLRCRFLQP
jgi:glycosyltransferase involved in cell wall biosynthesis